MNWGEDMEAAWDKYDENDKRYLASVELGIDTNKQLSSEEDEKVENRVTQMYEEERKAGKLLY